MGSYAIEMDTYGKNNIILNGFNLYVGIDWMLDFNIKV